MAYIIGFCFIELFTVPAQVLYVRKYPFIWPADVVD
jgi:hypothetical protein